MAKVKPIPDGYHSLTPYLIVKGGAKAIDFYKKAFSADERMRMPGPDGKTVGHAELTLGNSVLMLADEMPDMGAHAPNGPTPVGLILYVKDCDKIFDAAVKAGAKVVKPLADQFYGDRSGTVVDPFGHQWTIATHIKDMTPAEMQKAADAFMTKSSKK